MSLLVSGLFTVSCERRRAETVDVDRLSIPYRANITGSVFATYVGGSRQDFIRDVTTDCESNIYIAGGTESPDFPTMPGAYDGTFNGWHDYS